MPEVDDSSEILIASHSVTRLPPIAARVGGGFSGGMRQVGTDPGIRELAVRHEG